MRDELSVLSAFLLVAEERSFTRAAKQLNISTSGLSHAIRRLEEQIGVRLLTRTTRSVSPTDAGEQLLAHLRPALADIRGTLTTLSGLQTTPVGRVRLLCPSSEGHLRAYFVVFAGTARNHLYEQFRGPHHRSGLPPEERFAASSAALRLSVGSAGIASTVSVGETSLVNRAMRRRASATSSDDHFSFTSRMRAISLTMDSERRARSARDEPCRPTVRACRPS